MGNGKERLHEGKAMGTVVILEGFKESIVMLCPRSTNGPRR
jgi:hypothetical protein